MFAEHAAHLSAVSGGDEQTAAALFESVYDELRALAQSYFRRARPDDTLQPTALVHEVYVRIARSPGMSFRGREHFVAVAATAMRQILVDRERSRRREKRGGGATHVTLTSDVAPTGRNHGEVVVDVLTLDAALTGLSRLSERQARIVEMLYFGGLTVEETAKALGVSFSLAEKEWRTARAWLRRELAAAYE